MIKKALIVQGGWEGHEPAKVSQVFSDILTEEGFQVEVSDTLDSFLDEGELMNLNLIVPVWSMGEIKNEQLQPVLKAVASGVGIAGCHGGMCDSFRNSVEWQFMTGSQWVAHPGNDGIEYEVNIVNSNPSNIIHNIQDFKVRSEKYYLHIDPAINVLATTTFQVNEELDCTNVNITMPVLYTKTWGKGKVFYNSLGHNAEIFNIPEVRELMRRGFLWAAK